MLNRIAVLLKNSPSNIRGQITNNHITLDISGEDVHYWSPQLNFRVEADEENQHHSVVSGLVGPRPAVWSLFLFVYATIGIIALFISFFAVSELLLGKSSNLLFAFPVALLFMLTAYLVGKYGEKLAKDQVDLFKQFVRDAVYFEGEKQH
ncbi:hypothetical protein [Tunicatimonas pelagia]|uniref:hypothetical protein n=1 Tax=Tunicatimonas pelagia TaxID=931531 RepID=UPI0026662FF0|nr:hypothetical protein [Tunicatimonas pelagia]WKN40659.1 hypothetical protein P0M28_16595 [Tunicatimonas pelagia]